MTKETTQSCFHFARNQEEPNMNMGLVAGYLLQPDSDKIQKDSLVQLTWIQGDVGKIGFTGEQGKNRAYTTTDSRGRFIIPFGWSGAEIGSGILNIQMALYAELTHQEEGTTEAGGHWTSVTPIALARVFTKGYVIENVSARFGLTAPDLQSAPGLLGFAKDLIEAYRKIKAVPIPNVGWTSSEAMLMVGAVTIQLAWT
jgi:hypothetical protein